MFTDFHGFFIGDVNRSWLSIKFEEYLPLSALLFLSFCQGHNVQGLSSFQLNLETISNWKLNDCNWSKVVIKNIIFKFYEKK